MARVKGGIMAHKRRKKVLKLVFMAQKVNSLEPQNKLL